LWRLYRLPTAEVAALIHRNAASELTRLLGVQ
jgi:hypothetical protein